MPGPVIRATEDDLLRVHFANGSHHPHTIHFHGIHPADMDRVFEVVNPGGRFTYGFRPAPTACTCTTAMRADQAPSKRPLGAFIIDPPSHAGRPASWSWS